MERPPSTTNTWPGHESRSDQVYDGVGDVRGTAGAPQRRLPNMHIRGQGRCVIGERDGAGCNGVDCDGGGESARQAARQHDDAGLGYAVGSVLWPRQQPTQRREVDDARPRPLRASSGAARCAQKNCAFKFPSSSASHCASVGSPTGVGANTPALLTRMSKRPKCASASWKRRSISALCVRSARRQSASPPPRAISAATSLASLSEVPVVHNDARSLGGQPQRQCAADAPSRASGQPAPLAPSNFPFGEPALIPPSSAAADLRPAAQTYYGLRPPARQSSLISGSGSFCRDAGCLRSPPQIGGRR